MPTQEEAAEEQDVPEEEEEVGVGVPRDWLAACLPTGSPTAGEPPTWSWSPPRGLRTAAVGACRAHTRRGRGRTRRLRPHNTTCCRRPLIHHHSTTSAWSQGSGGGSPGSGGGSRGSGGGSRNFGYSTLSRLGLCSCKGKSGSRTSIPAHSQSNLRPLHNRFRELRQPARPSHFGGSWFW